MALPVKWLLKKEQKTEVRRNTDTRKRITLMCTKTDKAGAAAPALSGPCVFCCGTAPRRMQKVKPRLSARVD
ncbi:hypothetical protein A8L50_22940 [Pantoea ananatis]|jgi:hypothetical protein|nr:hypothetical protein [Pantoea ananatis]